MNVKVYHTLAAFVRLGGSCCHGTTEQLVLHFTHTLQIILYVVYCIIGRHYIIIMKESLWPSGGRLQYRNKPHYFKEDFHASF